MQLRGIALAVLLLASPVSAHAAGFWNFDKGVSNYARGGANIAAPEDPIALYTNPAALAGLPGIQFHLDGDAVWDESRFERAPDRVGNPRFCCRETRYPGVTNEMPTYPSPGFFASWNLANVGVPRLTVGAGLYGPHRSDVKFPADGPQRYSTIEQHNLQIHKALAVAYELPWKKLRLGVTAMAVDQVIDSRLAFNTFFGEPMLPEDPGYDADVSVLARDDNNPTAALGVSIAPVDAVTLAASYQHGWDVAAKGRAKGVLGDDIGTIAELRSGDITVKTRLPPIARAAAKFAPVGKRWDVEAAFVWEGWSRNDAVTFIPKQPGGLALVLPESGVSVRVPTIPVKTYLRDTYSLRLGGETEVMPGRLTLRSGVWFERAAIAPKHLNAANFDLDKAGLSAGARVELVRGAWLDLTGGYQHWFPVTVKDNDIRIFDPLAAENRWAIGNGRYENSRVVVMAGIGMALGKR